MSVSSGGSEFPTTSNTQNSTRESITSPGSTLKSHDLTDSSSKSTWASIPKEPNGTHRLGHQDIPQTSYDATLGLSTKMQQRGSELSSPALLHPKLACVLSLATAFLPISPNNLCPCWPALACSLPQLHATAQSLSSSNTISRNLPQLCPLFPIPCFNNLLAWSHQKQA